MSAAGDSCPDGHPADGQPRSPSRSSSEPTCSPPSSPSPSPPPRHRPIPFKDEDFSAITYYAERSHLNDLADPETAFLQQLGEVHPDLDPRTAFDIPDDPISRRFTILADAARDDHRGGEYSAPATENIGGYLERAMRPLMDEIEQGMEMTRLDEAAIVEAYDLLVALEDGFI